MERLLRGCDAALGDGDEAREVVRVDRGCGGRGEARAKEHLDGALAGFAAVAARHRRRRDVDVGECQVHERDVARRADHHLALLHDIVRNTLDAIRHLALVPARRQARRRRLHHPRVVVVFPMVAGAPVRVPSKVALRPSHAVEHLPLQILVPHAILRGDADAHADPRPVAGPQVLHRARLVGHHPRRRGRTEVAAGCRLVLFRFSPHSQAVRKTRRTSANLLTLNRPPQRIDPTSAQICGSRRHVERLLF